METFIIVTLIISASFCIYMIWGMVETQREINKLDRALKERNNYR